MWDNIGNLIKSMIVYFICIWIGNWIVSHIWEEPMMAIPLLLKGHIFTALVTIFLMWFVYTISAMMLIAGEKRSDLLAGIILLIVLGFNWTSDLKEAYDYSGETFGPAITGALIYICATFPDFIQLIGFGSAIYYRDSYLAGKSKNVNNVDDYN